MSALSGALGSIIGYLGAEVAEATIFERLLWPQRFYNDFNLTICIKLALLMPMGGPLHRAALQTLDAFNENGLYLGSRRGDMLGTAFYSQLPFKYFARSIVNEEDMAKEVRNGFWVEVLRSVPKKTKSDPPGVERAVQPVHRLKLQAAVANDKIGVIISEDAVSWRSFAGICSSELSAVAISIAIGVDRRSIWLACYLCVPLLLKFLAVCVSVHRDPIQTDTVIPQHDTPPSSPQTEIFQIEERPGVGYSIIEGPDPVVQQFFRHFGHPKRKLKWDRFREVASIIIVYAFVLYFPAGLVSLLWMDPTTQYYWLGYQIYTIIAMHVARLLGFMGCGRTEERIAKLLNRERRVILQSKDGSAVSATLHTEEATSVQDARDRVKNIILDHGPRPCKM